MTDKVLWYFIEFATTLFEMFVTYMFFKSVLGINKSVKKSIYFINLLTITIFSTVVYIYNPTPQLTVTICLLTRLFYSLLFEGKIKAKLLYTVTFIAIMALAEIFTAYLFIILTNLKLTFIVGNGPYRLAGILISKILLMINAKILSITRNYKNLDMPIRYWLIIFSTPLFSVIVTLTLSIYSGIIDVTLKYLALITSIYILYVDIIVFVLFDKSIEYFNLKTQNKLLEQQSDYEFKFYQNIKASDNKIRVLRHDMKNHLICISELIRTQKFEEAENYINLLADISMVNSRCIFTNNSVFDSIINAKAMLIKEKNIEFTYNIEIPQKINIEPIDMCILFGNTLDNAIEACNRIANGTKKISVLVTYRNNSLFLSITNTTDGKLKKRGDTFLSSKNNRDEHGIGLSNIERTVEKYNGLLNLNHRNNIFELTAVLYNI
jgi:two-component system, LytTR family, sensor histidine kinase AgrC